MTACVLAVALAGCGATAPELETDAAQQLQAKVLAVAQSAAGNDHAGAMKSLDELVAQLDASAAEGDVSFKRHQSIMTAVDAVRADLTVAQAQSEAAEMAAEQAVAAASKAATPPEVEAPAPTQGTAGQGKGEKGKDKDD